jgi:hypothetical protein
VRTSLAATLLAGLALAADLGARAEEMAAPPIAVIVGPRSPVTHVSVDDLRELYLRRRRVWPDGRRAIPINLPADHPVRERFSRLVLGRATQDLVAYWDARYFEGITPPTVLPSPAAIRAYLAAEPAAVGYVPLGDVDETCRTLLVLGR